MNKIIVLAALTLCVNLAMAGGGKVREQSPLYDISGEVVGTVVPVPDACEVVVPQSGKAFYIICDEGDE